MGVARDLHCRFIYFICNNNNKNNNNDVVLGSFLPFLFSCHRGKVCPNISPKLRLFLKHYTIWYLLIITLILVVVMTMLKLMVWDLL